MMSLARGAAKKMLASISKFKSFSRMVKKACDPENPSLEKSLSSNRSNLDSTFQELFHDYAMYKADASEDVNGVDENGDDKFEYNDKWMESIENEYYELIDLSDDKLEVLAKRKSGSNDVLKPDSEMIEQKVKSDESKIKKLVHSQFKSEKKAITDSITLTSSTVNDMPSNSIGASQGQAFRSTLQGISSRMASRLQDLFEQLLKLVEDSEAETLESEFVEFTSLQSARIDSIEMAIVAKTKESPAAVSAGRPSSSGSNRTYLKKVEPPKFLGDMLDFPEFKRRWIANVTNENLDSEAELDRLRDNVPDQAKKMLIGEKSMDTAWKILTKLYGNKTMIANKLKIKLKNIKSFGSEDHDIVISLAVEIKSIVKNLTELKMQDMLKYDDEYLSAIFRALPSQARIDWLKYDKDSFESKWEAMEKFMDEQHEIATNTKVLLSSYVVSQPPAESIRCKKCHEFGHKKFECPQIPTAKLNAVKTNDVDSSDDDQNQVKSKDKQKADLRKLFGACPLCKSQHSFKKKRDGQMWPSDRMSSCEEFRKKTETERASVLEKNKSCPRCLSWMHGKDSKDCKAPKNSCNKDKGTGTSCHGDHSRMVCGSGNVYCATTSYSRAVVDESSDSDTIPVNEETIMLLEDVRINSSNTCRTLWDNGSNRVLVNNTFAKEQNLRSTEVTYKLSVVGGRDTIEKGVIHEVEITENNGNVHKIWGFGIDTIMDPPTPVNMHAVRHLFPHVPSNVFDPLPTKRIDILMGLNFFSLHPDGGQGRNSKGNLKMLHSKFSKGWLLGGSHPALNVAPSILTQSALTIARVCRVEVKPQFSIKSELSLKPYNNIDFWEADGLGVLAPKRCGRCLKCPDCNDKALIHSRKEQDELEMLKKSIKLENGQLNVSYPFIKSPECFPNNRNAAIAMATKLESRLRNKGQLERYNTELMKYITRGILVPISEAEMAEYKGPVNYISHHGVEKDSVTTPLRIVTNSSLKNGIRSLNDCLPKGPSSLNPMFDIIVRFRSYEVGLLFDLTKAYNSLKTGVIEKHLRRLIWRFSNEEPWQDFGYVVVVFGDRCAAELLELARGLTADAGQSIDPEASRKLKGDSYVDDGVTGGSRAAVIRMKGIRQEDGSYSGTMSQILSKGNLRVKAMLSSYEEDKSAIELMGSKVLGYLWHVEDTDQLAVLLPMNISGRVRKIKQKPDLTIETLHLLETTKFTKRVCLSIANSVVDILGIACPFILRFKLLMKQVFEDSDLTGWNVEIKEDSKKAWVDLITEAVFAGSVCFPRTTRPSNAVGGPSIIGFSDGSFDAFAAAVYLRWEVNSGGEEKDEREYVSNLLAAKSRVTPLNGMTIPRAELNGLLLLSRLSLTVARALSTESELHPASAILLTDSECSISVLEKSSSSMKPYFHNRVSEIGENMEELSKVCDVEQVHHVAGVLNVADMATHGGVKVNDIGPGSLWQRGPAFLACRRDSWPVTREFCKVEIPDEEARTRKTNAFAAIRVMVGGVKASQGSTGISLPLLDAVARIMCYSNSFKKVLNILARVIRAWKSGKTAEIVRRDVVATELVEAERLVLLSAMPATFSAWQTGKLDSLLPKMDGRIIVTVGRIGEVSLTRLLGVASLPILLPSTRAAFLYMMRAHCGDDNFLHKSPVETLARSRTAVWIVRGKNLAKSLWKSCPVCIKRRKELCSQQIAMLKPESLAICRPWTYICIDFAGPVVCKGVVNARARKKCWVLVYVCRSTKAVCLLATAGYDTASFLLRHEEFVARKGSPKHIVSDQGSQLLAAGLVIVKKESPESWDWDKVKRENSTSTWEYVPAGSQHHNGLSEAMVKGMKRSLVQALNPGVVLAYHELVTLLARISCSINSRPLGYLNTSNTDQQEDVIMPLTPNDMLLGRSSPESPPLEYSEDDKFSERLAYISAVESDWWRRWTTTVLPTMLPARKWKKEKENLEVGDVVLLNFPKAVKDEYIHAIVTEVLPDDKGLVRRVVVKYRRKNSKEPKNVCKSKMEEKIVAVQRLSLLVRVPRSDEQN